MLISIESEYLLLPLSCEKRLTCYRTVTLWLHIQYTDLCKCHLYLIIFTTSFYDTCFLYFYDSSLHPNCTVFIFSISYKSRNSNRHNFLIFYCIEFPLKSFCYISHLYLSFPALPIDRIFGRITQREPII